MKNSLYFLFLALTSLMFFSCGKDNIDPYPDKYEIRCTDYTQLKVGNYWIYQRYTIDSMGFATPLNKYDSCYVAKDTSINDKVYFKVYRPSLMPLIKYVLLRDSLHYLVDHRGMIHFSHLDFTSIFYERYIVTFDTMGFMYTRMDDKKYR
ncbi:MAG: hypothetical protein Q7J34_06535 [Bacteroidales bacterium]|jgi:hypothetical protein|nr:hypothetical protein [Bacteroidales bacterium]